MALCHSKVSRSNLRSRPALPYGRRSAQHWMLCCAAAAQCAAGQHNIQYRPPPPARPTVNQSPVPGTLFVAATGVSLTDPGYMSRKFESLERINSISETNRSFDSCNSRKRLGYHPVPAAAAPPRRPVLDGSPAVYMSYMSQNFCLLPVSNLSVLNFRIFLLMYPESSETRRWLP